MPASAAVAVRANTAERLPVVLASSTRVHPADASSPVVPGALDVAYTRSWSPARTSLGTVTRSMYAVVWLVDAAMPTKPRPAGTVAITSRVVVAVWPPSSVTARVIVWPPEAA